MADSVTLVFPNVSVQDAETLARLLEGISNGDIVDRGCIDYQDETVDEFDEHIKNVAEKFHRDILTELNRNN